MLTIDPFCHRQYETKDNIMKRLHTTKLMLPLLIQFGITCSAGMLPAPAAASVFYNGINCVRISGLAQVEDGIIFNPSESETLWVECPVIKDSFAGILRASMLVDDFHPTDDVRCNLYSAGPEPRNNDDSGLFASVGVGLQHIEAPRGVNGALGGVRTYFTCTIPPRTPSGASGIHAYTALPPL